MEDSQILSKYTAFVNQIPVGLYRLELKNIKYIDITLPIDEQVDLMFNHLYIDEANEYLAGMLNVESSKDILGHQLTDFVQITKEKRIALFKDIISSGYKKTDFEIYDALLHNGKKIHFSGNCVGILESNKFFGAWVVIRDVTEKRLTQKALEESEERYRMLTEEVPNIIWTSKPDGNLDFYNQRLYDYTGTKFDDIKGEGWIKILHPDDIEPTSKVWNKSIVSGDRFEVEFRIRRFDGAFRWFISRAVPIEDKNGEIIKWLGICTDIEDRKTFEDKIKEKNEDLDNFISMASHDLKAPVANIEGLVKALPDLMEDTCKREDAVSNVLNMINTSINKFKKNLMGMIEITKSQRESKSIENNKLSDIVSEVENTLEEPIRKSDAEIITDFNEAPTLNFSKKNLQSIVYNLLSNSIKYRSPERNPIIMIKTKLLNKYMVLTVQDNGLGFKKHQVNKVFSEFKRLHKNIEGTGVGLYLIKRIINNAGGKIELESEENKCSIFKVYFKI